MSKRKTLVFLLLLLLLGSVFLCGCYDGPIPIVCNYDAASDRWDCSFWMPYEYTDPDTGYIIPGIKLVRYTQDYCDPYSDPNKGFIIHCYGKAYAPPSPSPSPSPTPSDSGHYYKITELNGGNNGGGGGGGGGGPSPP